MGNHHPTSQQKSRDALERAGTFRKDRHGALRSPEPTAGTPEPPEPLTELAQREWDRVLWAFADLGALHKVDAHVLYQYVQLWGETEDIARQQAACEAGIAILESNLRGGHDEDEKITKTDLVQLFSEIVTLRKLVSKCTDQLRSGRVALRLFLVEFGLTPSSRSRIKLPPLQAPEVDAFTSMQQRRAAG